MIFDEKQKQAVVAKQSKVMVVAGPGAGKTTMLVGRVSHLIENGVSPDRILCLTFSKSMAEQLDRKVNADGGRIQARTFHSFFLSVLKEDPEYFGIPSEFSVDASGDFVRSALEDANYDIPDDEALGTLMKAREGLSDFSELNSEILKLGKVDFSMMASLVVAKMREDFAFLDDLQNRFDHILVDEYQDVNPVQQMFIDLIGACSNVWIIGDDDQAIYEFRASAPSSLADFKTKWSDCLVVKTNRNYRSFDPIVSLSQTLISFNQNRIKKRVSASSGVGSALVRCYADLDSEVKSVCAAARRLIKNGCPANQIAILSRTNKFLYGYRQHAPNGVALSTFHGSKGLEWRYVFVVGMSQGHSPSSLSSKAEERRLAYVAFSRARLGLRISFSLADPKSSYRASASQFIDEAGLSLFTGVDRDMFTSHLNLGHSYVNRISYERPYGTSDAGLSMQNIERDRPERANLPWSFSDDLKLENMINNNDSIIVIVDRLKRTRSEIMRRCQKKGLSLARAKLRQSV